MPKPTTQHDPVRDDPKPDETRRGWEDVQTNGSDDKTERLKILGGWLYRTVTSSGVALVHVPDQRA